MLVPHFVFIVKRIKMLVMTIHFLIFPNSMDFGLWGQNVFNLGVPIMGHRNQTTFTVSGVEL